MVTVFNHPLINIKLSKMRDKHTSHKEFRNNLNEIASLMVYEIMRDYKCIKTSGITPLNIEYEGYKFDKEIVIIPILRAGLGMVEGILDLIPEARVGHIGMYRNEETLTVTEYFFKIPNVSKDSKIIVVDPMLATGASASNAINKLESLGFNDITLVSLVGVQEGINTIQKNHPKVDIFLASKDKHLNENNYIVPGLGDAGDRIFGTK
ncbi:uracil phosphoribosyltransferase [Mycoplasmopsis verecunda]|uniref:Uracil phosphoribosyltransferase n=1 Tax=Mycoplasmopsis verecunda TaxID=171291 RepID=A0A1T4KTU5_9BACT|nr:uracil phosphoribosyltransferase [Mycoplasmopsis verecunda]WPB54907.1 uracil phosphoribosyltransferase [Mycoplasmopsis verecunda]SJZ45864.1 uracil phosphoribosyltransferase [Mycoplasmopsis verecunda]